MPSDRMRALIDLVCSVKSIVEDHQSIENRYDKGDNGYTTDIDLKIQSHIFERLKEQYPGYQCMGEENTDKGLDLARPTWILDPIDGTNNLIHHNPQCSVALGLMVNREIELGIVYNPFLDQLFYAEKGRGAYMDGRRIYVSGVDTLKGSLISVGTAPYSKQYARRDFGIHRHIFERCQDIRRSGSAALDMAYVACDIIEAYYEHILRPWDYAAAMIIVEEAGGKVTTVDGNPISNGRPCFR